MKISIITPIYNEEGNIKQLFDEIAIALIGYDYEIIGVNDGSSDNSDKILNNLAKTSPNIKAIHMAGNFGQTAAISCGIEHSTGDIIILIDSDLENDPSDIIKILKKMEEGYGVVSGWRKNRWGNQMITRKIPSFIANRLISRIAGLKLNDYGCTLKAYKKDIIAGVPLYGEMHRFIPAYAASRGVKVGEVEVNFRPRKSGKSNYGMWRIFKVILDLIVVKFLNKYIARPMHFFGGVGFIIFFLGVLSGVVSVALKISGIRDFVSTPLPIFTALLVMVGVQLVAMGVVAEMIMRTYFESRGKKPYQIKEKINL